DINNDEILPMPCGGKIAFRKVETESDGLYGDQAIRIGDANIEEDRYKSNPVNTYIAGGFQSSSKGKRYLLVGKYEITQLQYASIMKGDSTECPDINDSSALPQTKVNWFDAVEFTKRYSLWLQQYYLENSDTRIPKKDKELGFVRLPTEVEWEFAARGGLLTKTQADYQQSTFFPSDDSASKYIWYAGSESANGKLHKIGKLSPNPLGIYDILGNVDEVVFDLFHLTHQRTDHLHGETGGYVVRGGNYLDDVRKIYSARREEIPFFSEGKLHPAASTTGFRVVVAAPVITGTNAGQLADAWQHLSSINTLATTEKTTDQPYQLISTLSEKTDDTVLKNQLNELSAQLNAQKVKYDEQLTRAAREALRTASILCQKLNDDNPVLTGKLKLAKLWNCEQSTSEYKDRCDKNNLEHNKKVYDHNKRLYADAVLNLSGFNLDMVNRQKQLWVQEIEAKEFTHIRPYPDVVYSHVEQYVKSNNAEIENWNKSCTDVRP
ncbi:MAG: formylglycine-generating enzyme family protein, partial [Mucilaginibacter sp.]